MRLVLSSSFRAPSVRRRGSHLGPKARAHGTNRRPVINEKGSLCSACAAVRVLKPIWVASGLVPYWSRPRDEP